MGCTYNKCKMQVKSRSSLRLAALSTPRIRQTIGIRSSPWRCVSNVDGWKLVAWATGMMQLAWRVFFGGGACQLEVGEVDEDHVVDSRLQHSQLKKQLTAMLQ